MAKKKTSPSKITPLMRQYLDMKAKYPDAILLYRVGDFYETFGADAITVSKVLGIVLTARNNGGSKIELAGFPYHSLDLYLPKLVKAGFRIAVCEQLERPSKEKKIVKRGVTEVVTPGLNSNENLLEGKENNYLAALYFDKKTKIAAVAFLDFTTGEFVAYEGPTDQVSNLIMNYAPAELLYAKGTDLSVVNFPENTYTYAIEDWIFDYDYCYEKITRLFEVQSLTGYGLEQKLTATTCCGAILHYLESTENKALEHLSKIGMLNPDDFLWLDYFTVRNLEILRPLQSDGKSLLSVLDHCATPMGSRKLRKWLLFPLISETQIEQRHRYIDVFFKKEDARDALQKEIARLGDLERLIARLAAGKFSPRQVIQLKAALQIFNQFKEGLEQFEAADFLKLANQIDNCQELANDIEKRFVEEPPILVGKSTTIADGFDPELDELNDLLRNAKQYLLDLQQREIARTGINNLKIGFNNVFGYYLEVTNRYKDQDLIPEDWIRKQTLTNAERYITPELKTLEEKIKNAEEKIHAIEHTHYANFLEFAFEFIHKLQSNAEIIANLDVLMSLAKVAVEKNYCKPSFVEEGSLDIIQGRHPVIEDQMPPGESFVPNNVHLNDETQQIMLITGPNMSGKSAVLRQTALICIMAQIGSYVPAEMAKVCLLDRIFTRVGASDNISSGESTFMVEMNETANILNNLSNRSLLLLDEIGRGTSTFDGISIAWSIVEYLHEQKNKRPFTLFATHYHELSELASKYERVKNFHVSTKKVGKKILFLRKLTSGSVEHSFGIYVARLAGMPKEVIKRSETILNLLESQKLNQQLKQGDNKKVLKDVPAVQATQMSFFQIQDEELADIRTKLNALDINSMTPVDCMLELRNLKNILSE